MVVPVQGPSCALGSMSLSVPLDCRSHVGAAWAECGQEWPDLVPKSPSEQGCCRQRETIWLGRKKRACGCGALCEVPVCRVETCPCRAASEGSAMLGGREQLSALSVSSQIYVYPAPSPKQAFNTEIAKLKRSSAVRGEDISLSVNRRKRAE